MLNLFLSFFYGIFRWFLDHVLLGIILFWILGKALGFSFKKTTSSDHKKFWITIMLILIILYIALKEGWINVRI